jgi:hypothetical protein
MFGAVALIGSFVTMATSSVLPAVYEKYGIYSGNGYENMYDILYDLPTLYRLVGVLVILSAVGAALNLVPYFFYDLTETKQKAIIKILKIRAMFEDYGNGVLTDADMRSTMALIREAKERFAAGKADTETLKKQKAPKAEKRAAAQQNEEYEIAQAVLEELDRFTTPAAQEKLIRARRVADAGAEGVAGTDEGVLAAAKALPAGTPSEKLIKKEAVADARLALRCKKAALKYYPDGVKPFDEARLTDLYGRETALQEQKAALLKQKAGKSAIADVSARLRQTGAEIKTAQEEYLHYAESTKVYREAKKYLAQAENYARFGELDDMYGSARDDG